MNIDGKGIGKLVGIAPGRRCETMVKAAPLRYHRREAQEGSIVTKSPYEIPPEMRDFAEKSVDQAKKAFDGFMDAAHRAAGTLEGSSDAVHSGGKDLGRKAMSYAEQNVASALDFASRLVNARDPQEI